jgi:hypothetical protein
MRRSCARNLVLSTTESWNAARFSRSSRGGQIVDIMAAALFAPFCSYGTPAGSNRNDAALREDGDTTAISGRARSPRARSGRARRRRSRVAELTGVTTASNAIEAVLKGGTAALVAVMVCACSHEKPKPIEENVYPADFRSQIADQVRRQVNPRNLRDAAISEPTLNTSLPTPRYVACVRFKATDTAGAVKGREMAAYFYAGKITQVVDAGGELCGKAAYLPFPELQ